jgi:hypothetical protein
MAEESVDEQKGDPLRSGSPFWFAVEGSLARVVELHSHVED